MQFALCCFPSLFSTRGQYTDRRGIKYVRYDWGEKEKSITWRDEVAGNGVRIVIRQEICSHWVHILCNRHVYDIEDSETQHVVTEFKEMSENGKTKINKIYI